VSLLHMTDCHAQLKPIHFREPSVNLGSAACGPACRTWSASPAEAASASPGHAAGARLHLSRLREGRAPLRQGRRLRPPGHAGQALKASRPGALLLDGGDTWQGSATALWTNGQDMVDACKLLGVDVMTGHWEFTYGMERVKEIVEKDFKGTRAALRIDFVAQNVKTHDFGDPVFKPYVIREINGVPVAIVGQAFPYTPIANPRYMVADWSFGIQDDQHAEDGRRGARQGRAGRGRAQPQRHGRRPEDGQPRARHRRHLRRPHARRRAVAGAGEERRRHRRWSPTPAATASSSA
jgi:sulfur-oxidizing protein SoxB